jgi:hypothetical protein
LIGVASAGSVRCWDLAKGEEDAGIREERAGKGETHNTK